MHNVLVVDDANTRRAPRQLLAGDGCHVTTSPDPLASLNEVSREKFDVVISDIKMPLMDVVSFIRESRRLRPGLAWACLL